jgi:hypothetical protein
MKTLAAEEEQFLTDAQGKRTAVLLDLRTYERLREAEEELADIQAYDANRARAHSEIAGGQFSALPAYRARRERKGK